MNSSVPTNLWLKSQVPSQVYAFSEFYPVLVIAL